MKAFTLWLTGLSGAGKTTLAKLIDLELSHQGIRVQLLDGDELRLYLSQDLGFSKDHRIINAYRIAYVAQLLNRNDVNVIVASISPYQQIRDELRNKIDNYHEIYVKCSIDRCIQRDVKGLYRKAIDGQIPNFTGISDIYEEPGAPDHVIDTENQNIDECTRSIIDYLENKGLLLSSDRILGGV